MSLRICRIHDATWDNHFRPQRTLTLQAARRSCSIMGRAMNLAPQGPKPQSPPSDLHSLVARGNEDIAEPTLHPVAAEFAPEIGQSNSPGASHAEIAGEPDPKTDQESVADLDEQIVERDATVAVVDTGTESDENKGIAAVSIDEYVHQSVAGLADAQTETHRGSVRRIEADGAVLKKLTMPGDSVGRTFADWVGKPAEHYNQHLQNFQVEAVHTD